MRVPLACPVRGCGRPLARAESAWRCALNHSFDVARTGYVNLLQPQDTRSRDAGDAVSAIRARSRLLAGGVGTGLLDEVARRVTRDEGTAVIVDLGCGAGEFLGRLADRAGVTIGIDLSVDAASMAARALPSRTWVVANADRRLPVLDASVDVVVSINARRNPTECGRILRENGQLIVAVPAGDDLVELRDAVLGHRVEQSRADALVTEHAPTFALDEIVQHRETHMLQLEQLQDLLTGTYRAARQATSARRASLQPMRVTLASEIVVLRKRPESWGQTRV